MSSDFTASATKVLSNKGLIKQNKNYAAQVSIIDDLFYSFVSVQNAGVWKVVSSA